MTAVRAAVPAAPGARHQQQLQEGQGQGQHGQGGVGQGGSEAGDSGEAEVDGEERQVLQLLTPSTTRVLALPSLQRGERDSRGKGERAQGTAAAAPLPPHPLLASLQRCKPQAVDPNSAFSAGTAPPSPVLALAHKLSGGRVALAPREDYAPFSSIHPRASHPSHSSSNGAPSRGTPFLNKHCHHRRHRLFRQQGRPTATGGLPPKGSNTCGSLWGEVRGAVACFAAVCTRN